MSVNKLHISVLFLIIILLASSCRKNKIVNPENYRIATVDETATGGATNHIRIVYLADGNVDSIINGTDYQKYTYFSSFYTVAFDTFNMDTITIDPKGNIKSIYASGDSIYFTFDGTRVIDRNEVGGLSTGANVDMYDWQNDDINSIIYQDGTINTYSYDKSRDAQTGDASQINEFLVYGRSFTKCKHIRNNTTRYSGGSLYGGGTTVQYEKDLYQFDDKGRISVLTRIMNQTNDTTTFRYTYY